MPVNSHGGTGMPDYGKYPAAALLFITEVPFYSQRPFLQLMFSGVFERFPNLKFVMTEMGCAWLPPMLRRLDGDARADPQDRTHRRDAVLRGAHPAEVGHRVLPAELLRRREPTGPRRRRGRHEIGIDKFMWGSDYPHDEGTAPFSREHLRQRFHDAPPDEMRKMLGENAGEALRLRPRRTGAAGAEVSARPSPSSPSRSRSCRTTRTRPYSASDRLPFRDRRRADIIVVLGANLARGKCEQSPHARAPSSAAVGILVVVETGGGDRGTARTAANRAPGRPPALPAPPRPRRSRPRLRRFDGERVDGRKGRLHIGGIACFEQQVSDDSSVTTNRSVSLDQRGLPVPSRDLDRRLRGQLVEDGSQQRLLRPEVVMHQTVIDTRSSGDLTH